MLSEALELAALAEGEAFCDELAEVVGEEVALDAEAEVDDAAEEEDSAGAESVELSEQPLISSVATRDADNTAGATSFFCIRD